MLVTIAFTFRYTALDNNNNNSLLLFEWSSLNQVALLNYQF